MRVMPCGVPWQWCLPESVGGEACSCKDSREGGVHTFVALASSVLLGYHIRLACTLWTLTCLRFESVFFASFLCRFGQRNDVPPRTVANSDKEINQNKIREDLQSSNPAMNPTANAGTRATRHQPRPPSAQPQMRTKTNFASTSKRLRRMRS